MPAQKIVLLVFFVCATQFFYSQVGVSQTTGCAPLLVNFTAPPGATSANWNFGNGSSTILNPTNIYGTPGVYNVTYSGVGGIPTSTLIQITVVANNVNPSFTYTIPASHCAPMQVCFNATGPTGATYQWAFGDGGGGAGKNTCYNFSLGGIFNPTLSVTDVLTGCTGVAINGPINVSTLPQLNISALPGLSSCVVPFSPAFSASLSTTGSPFGGALSYNWVFGGVNQSSNLTTPGTITYNNQGTYQVTLTGTDNNNCTTSINAQVVALQPTLAVTVPGTVCINGQQTYSSPPIIRALPTAQSSVPFTTWQMGDGNTITVNTPNPNTATSFSYNLYTTPGLKTLTITAAQGSCVETKTATIFVLQIVPQFTFTAPSFTCMPSMVANYVNQTTVNAGVALNYGWAVTHWSNNGAAQYTSSATNPTFQLTVGSLNPYAYFGSYAANAQLIATTALPMTYKVCSATIFHVTDTIWRPTARFKKNVKQGCAPLTVIFKDTSDVAHLNPPNQAQTMYPMTSYTWNNGANPATTSVGVVPPAIVSPTFVYSAPGTYTPFLAFNTAGGCSAISYVDTITVVNQPTVGPISVSTMSACVGTPVTVSMTAAPNASLMQHWHVESDRGFFSGCVSNSVSTWFFTHPGVQGFTVSSYQRSCKSETVAPQTILIRGPVAKVRFQTNCTNKKSVDFSIFLQEVATATLNYGDNTADILTGNQTGIVSDQRTHVYSTTGDKTVTLLAVNPGSGCTYSQTVIVKVREINADFTILNPVLCKGDALSLNASASTDVYSTCGRGYAWLMDNEPTVQTSTSITNYAPDGPLSPLFTSGQHTIALWVKDVNSCSSSVVKTFTVGSPTANFSFPSPVCISDMPVHFTNTSPQSPIAATNFTWNFGVGPTATLANVFSSQAPVFNYTAAIPGQSYTISLLATGLYPQCTDVITKTLQVVNPFTPELYPYEAGPCLNTSTAFNVVNGGFTYSVNFGDGSPVFVSTQTTIAHTFTTSGVYTPTISIGSGACVNSALSWVPLTVPLTPTASFISYYTNLTSTLAPVPVGSIQCSPANLTFSSTSTPASNLVYNWSIQGLGPTAPTPTILTTWGTLGIYTVTLRVHPNGSEKCPGVNTKTFSVISPTAQAVVDKNRICLGETVKASLKDTNNILGWVWVVAGSSNTVFANSMPSPSVSYVFNSSGDNKINIRYFGPGYFCPGSSEVNVNVVEIKANFKRNTEQSVADSAHCLSISDFFDNKSLINNSPVGDGLNYAWNFGNGSTSSSLSPAYTYPAPGVYTVTLLVTEPALQCKSTAVKHMTIYPIPSANVSAIDSVCRGNSFQLSSNTSSDVTQYQWLPLIGLNNPNASVTAVVAQTSASYSLVVTNNFGCETTSRGEYVYVQQPPPSYKWDTTVIIGEPINLNSHLGPNYTYTWTPPDALSCINCLFPISTSTIDITYTLQVQDQLACFRVFNPYKIHIDPKTSIDVPSAFTPNGDGTNDVIYVDGWGIKKLNYFRIFNRWGQLLFESNDIKIGWDGTYNGVPQNMETYVYQVSAETYIPDKSLQKSSNFKLIR